MWIKSIYRETALNWMSCHNSKRFPVDNFGLKPSSARLSPTFMQSCWTKWRRFALLPHGNLQLPAEGRESPRWRPLGCNVTRRSCSLWLAEFMVWCGDWPFTWLEGLATTSWYSPAKTIRKGHSENSGDSWRRRLSGWLRMNDYKANDYSNKSVQC